VRLGEESIIAQAGEPGARLIPEARAGKRRELGAAKGQIWIPEDFDDPCRMICSICLRARSWAAARARARQRFRSG
jgi:antitoxin (DNA-binding transcriptional repressor) of toxin-antitoxin stability system